jgi:hypothetical protein
VYENPSSGGNAVDSAMCQEYVLRGDDVLFHLRAKDGKHPQMLPVGKDVSYRIEEDRFFLRVAANDRKEREYQVVSMEPREKPEGVIQSAMKINHLQ